MIYLLTIILMFMSCTASLQAQMMIEPMDGYQFKAAWKGDTVIVKLSGIESITSVTRQGTTDDGSRGFLGKILPPRYDMCFEFDTVMKDDQGRLLAYVFLLNGTFLNEMIVGAGMATVDEETPNKQYLHLLKAAQENARKRKLGKWSRLPEK